MALRRPAEPLDLGQISLRQRESALLTGGSQTGKTTLADYLRDDFAVRYRTARVHIADTKPRYRAQWLPSGLSAARLYRQWDHGPVVRDSVLVSSPAEMDQAWRTGKRITVCSTEMWKPAQDLCIAHFHATSRRGRPQLVDVDETGDHFFANGTPRGSGAVVVTSRAGMERGEGGLYCTQRTKGISPHMMEHMRRLYAFAMDVADDAKRFAEFGCPIRPEDLPQAPFEFLYWYKGDPRMTKATQLRLRRTVWGPYQLQLPPGPKSR